MTPLLAWLVGVPLLGALTGNRAMTPMMVLSWFAYRGRFEPGHLGGHHSWTFWISYLPTAIIFTVLALGEYVGDKLPNTPNRTAWFPLVSRIGFGGLIGALAATELHGAWVEGAMLGAISAFAGTFLGFHLRHYLTHQQGLPDLPVALAEDVATIALAVLAAGMVTA